MFYFLVKYKFTVLGVFLGALGGWLYYKKVGCYSGTCPITSNPYLSILYGVLLGYLLFSELDK